jgi:phosphomannomutase
MFILSGQETLTGFKWIANRAVDFQKEGKVVLFSFEEAIGWLIYIFIKLFLLVIII